MATAKVLNIAASVAVLRTPSSLLEAAQEHGAVVISALEAVALPEPLPSGFALRDREGCVPGLLLVCGPQAAAPALDCLTIEQSTGTFYSTACEDEGEEDEEVA